VKAPPPLTITKALKFKDVRGLTFTLYVDTAKHIILDHRIYHLEKFVRNTLLNPCTIIESKYTDKCQLYYAQKKSKKGYRVVVVNIVKYLIKTAYPTKKFKEGKVIW